MTTAVPELASVLDAIAGAREADSKGWEALESLPEWTVYTDGSAPIKNPGGAIGFSAVFLLNPGQAWEICGGVPGRTSDPPTSNNRAEIAGVLSILEVLYLLHKEGRSCPGSVEIVCDSQYVVNCAQGRWKKHKNRDLWARFDQVASACRRNKVKVTYRWTRAHVGTEWNERADVLAKEGAMKVVGRSSSSGQSSEPVATCDYTLRLFSQMMTKTSAQSVYELRTSKRNRQQRIDIEDVITADEAEYHNLRLGLSDLLRTLSDAGRDPSDYTVGVETSRDLMLKQLEGIYGVKSERLIPLHRECRALIGMFAEVSLDRHSKTALKSLLD